jgi:hypothetical protein
MCAEGEGTAPRMTGKGSRPRCHLGKCVGNIHLRPETLEVKANRDPDPAVCFDTSHIEVDSDVATKTVTLRGTVPTAAVRSWFARRLGEPTPPSARAGRSSARGRHALAAPTGSGNAASRNVVRLACIVERICNKSQAHSSRPFMRCAKVLL